MSIAAATMSRATGMQYSSAGSAQRTMDSKRSLASSSSSDYRGLSAKDSALDTQLKKDELEYEISGKMEEQSETLEDEWAESFNTFGE